MFRRRSAAGITVVLLLSMACAFGPDPIGASAVVAPSPRWQTDVGLSSEDAASDDSGVTVVTGETLVEDRENYLLTALDAIGAELWSDTFQPIPDETSGTWGEAVTVDHEGRVYAIGNAWHCRYGCESGFWFIRAYTSDGTLRWAHGGQGWKDPHQWRATGIDAWSRGIVVSGFDYDDDVGATRSWVRSYRFDGSLRWVRSVAITGRNDIRLTANSIAVSRNGTAVVVGFVEPDVGLGIDHDQEPFVQKLSARGETGWTRVFRERGDHDYDSADAVDVRGQTVVVGGVLGNGIGFAQPVPHIGWLARLSRDGIVRWMRSWGVAHPQDVEDVAIVPSGGILTVGGVQTADTSFALILRTYGASGRLVTTWDVNPDEGSLVGTAVSVDAAGTSIAGTLYGNRYLDPGKAGRVWRF